MSTRSLFLAKHSNLGVSALGALALVGAVLLGGCGENPDNYKITVNFEPAGSGSFVFDPADYKNGDKVSVKTIPTSGKYVFTEWAGDATGAENPVTVTLDGNKTLTAKFEELFAVTTNVKPMGSGTIARNPNKDYYHSGDTVAILVSTTTPGYKFVGWNDTTTKDSFFAIRIISDTTFTANFKEQFRFKFKPEPADGGIVILNPAKDYYADGDVVTIRALANKDYMFLGWKDPIDGSISIEYNETNPYTVTVGENSDILLIPLFFKFGGL
jgi:uncharacterized repeat protein (TIGR02543 family)